MRERGYTENKCRGLYNNSERLITEDEDETVTWEMLKSEWVTTSISLYDLSQKYGIAYGAINRAAKAQDWRGAAEEYNAKVRGKINEIMEEKIKIRADKLKALDDAAIGISERLIEMVDDAISKLDMDRPEDVSKIVKYQAALKSASETLRNTHGTARLAGDRATNIIKTDNSESMLPEDRARIEKELGLFGHSGDQSLSEDLSSSDVAGTEPSQDTQK